MCNLEYLLGWLCHLDTHFFSRLLEASHSDTRLAFLFKTSRGIAFRHPFGISFQDLSRHRFQTPVWHFFSRPLEASLSDTRLAFLFKTSRGIAFRHPFGISFQDLSRRRIQTPVWHFSWYSSGGPTPDVPFYFLGILGRYNAQCSILY